MIGDSPNGHRILRDRTFLFRLDGRTALVTGGSKGLGQSMARAIAAAGANVIVTSRHLAEAQESADAIVADGRSALAIEADTTDRNAVQNAVRQGVERFGTIDILVNNAGINIRKPALEVGDADWDPVIGINLKGCLHCAQAVAPGMISQKWGRIINMGSILSTISIPGRAAYATSKHGLIGLTKTLALEWAQYGVTVNAICPGPFGTPMNKQLLSDPKQYEFFISKIPMGRWGEPEELDGAVLFLAGEASSFVTGTTIYVDGGWTAQ